MKIFKIVFSCLSLFLVGNISAQSLNPAENFNNKVTLNQFFEMPNDSTINFSVINISQENEDAEISGANAGDTLRYELKIKTTSSDLIDFEISVDISDVLVATDIIDNGLGDVVGNNLVFPAFSQSAPCEKVFSFFVRVKEDCGRIEKITSEALGQKTNVEIKCDLPQTGAGNQIAIWISFLMGIIVILGIRKVRV